MRNLARRAGRLAIVPVLAGAAVFGPATPAVAAPPTPQPEPEVTKDCSESVGDGIVVCVIVEKASPESSAFVSAAVQSAFADMKGALVVLEACDGGGCFAQEVATGENTAEVRTKSQQWGRGTGYYRANASMVDERNHTYSGVAYPDW